MSIQAKICREFEWTKKEIEARGFTLCAESSSGGEFFVLRNKANPKLRDDCKISVFETLAEVRCYMAGMAQQSLIAQFGCFEEDRNGQEAAD